MTQGMAGSNWAGNYVYGAAKLHHPSTLAELRELVAAARSIRALGSRHSFTSIADADELVAFDAWPIRITIDPSSRSVLVSAAVTYARLAARLSEAGWALSNLASLPHISVAGAVATATHGSGDGQGNLATAVIGLELLTSSGELIWSEPGDGRFEGLVVGLGALGVVTRLRLSIEPYYEMGQRVFEDLEWETLLVHFDEITARGDSVSVFHRFGERTEQVWVKRRAGATEPSPATDLFGAPAAVGPRHPIGGGDPVNCTAQLGIMGAWSERLPHFRSGFTPSSGEEIQSEFFVARGDATAAIEALRGLSARIRPLLLVAEIRTVAGDELWLSPHYKRPSVGLHFTWKREEEAVETVLREVEAALERFAPRPHWGKLFTARADTLAGRYERLEDFRRLRAELDPRGAFDSRWLRSRALGDP